MTITTIYNKIKNPEFWLGIYAWNSITMIGGKIALLLSVLAYPNPTMTYAFVASLFNNSVWGMSCLTQKKWSWFAINVPFLAIDAFCILYIAKVKFF